METKEKKITAKDVELVRSNIPQIVIPDGMELDEVIEWCKRKREDEEREVAIYHELPYSPVDGMVALQKALTKIYGWTSLTNGDWGTPPTMVGVKIGPHESIQVPWGRMVVPTLSGYLENGMKTNPTPLFTINGKCRRKHEGAVKKIVDTTLSILKEESIYKGKAIKISFEWERLGERFDPLAHCPKFIDLSGVDEEDLIFSKAISNKLDIALFHPVEYSDACRRARIPLKRGVLLSGKYGVGKTLAAYVTAKKAIRNGWTFVYLESVQDLKKGLQFAAQYAPAVLFVEDIDRAITGNRTYTMDEVLNILDGVDTKGTEIVSVFTTNHLSDINSAMKRPGRLDTIVNIEPPDAEAAARIVGRYSRGLLTPGTELTQVGKEVAGCIPAIIREVVERAKIAAIGRTNGGDIANSVSEIDLLNAAESMKEHARLIEESGDKKPKTPEVLVRIPQGHLTENVMDLLQECNLVDA